MAVIAVAWQTITFLTDAEAKQFAKADTLHRCHDHGRHIAKRSFALGAGSSKSCIGYLAATGHRKLSLQMF
jgi:hypothetical protein